MKGSGSEPIKGMSEFLQFLDTFNDGTSEDRLLISKFDWLLSQNRQLGSHAQLSLKESINSADLSQEITGLLLDKINEESTLLIQPDPTDSSQENRSEQQTHSSSLLKKLLQCNDIQQKKIVEVGQIIRNSYRLESILGRGGMGKVWKALDLIQEAGEAQDRHVAIKFIDQEIKSHPDALKALVREFARYKKLIHPNIVKAYELNHDENEIFIVMEYLQGISLKEYIRQNPEGISLKQAQPIIKSMCDALEYAHNEGIVHLDFKPSNIVYNPETHSCKIIDFGIARLSCSTERDKTLFDPGDLGAITTAYASSEMLTEIEPDRRDDIYGLACVVYELLSGQHPFKRHRAIKAEREKIQPNQIPTLNKKEFQGLLHGLNFRRPGRTASAKQFYSELFLPKPKKNQERNKLLIGIGATVAVALVTYLLYTGYIGWKFEKIIANIEQGLKPGMDEFLSLSVDEEQDLFLKNPNLSLIIANYATQQKDALAEINKFDPIIQRILYSDRQVSDYLIILYSHQIDQAISTDDFQLADQLSHNIVQHYPDSLRLVEQSKKIQIQKKVRLTTLKLSHQQCVSDKTKNLADLFPCLQQTRSLIRKINKTNPVLRSPAIHDRYNIEINSAIRNKKFTLAEQLIVNWRELEPKEIKQRSKLKLKLAHSKEVEQFNNQILNSNNLLLVDILTLLPTLEPSIREDILSNKKNQHRLMTFYKETTDQFLSNNHFDNALENISEGQSLFSDNDKAQQNLKVLAKKVKKKKSSFISQLENSLKKQFTLKEPDIQKIQTIHSKIADIAPGNPNLHYPELAKNYTDKINTAINKRDFSLAQRLLDDWKMLKPSDLKTEKFEKISTKKVVFLQAFQRKQDFIARLQSAINNNQLNKVDELIIELKNQFSIEDKKQIISNYTKQLLNVYQQHIDSELKKYAYDSANQILNRMQIAFPEHKQIKVSKKDISKAIKARVNDFLSQFSLAINTTTLHGPAIFSPLLEIRKIDPEYFNNNSNIFNKLKQKLLTRVDNKEGLPQLQTVIYQWKQFLSSSEKNSTKNIEIYRKTKNLIALRCLFKGRKLEEQNLQKEATEFFMFGLSLDPITRIKEVIEKELLP